MSQRHQTKDEQVDYFKLYSYLHVTHTYPSEIFNQLLTDNSKHSKMLCERMSYNIV